MYSTGLYVDPIHSSNTIPTDLTTVLVYFSISMNLSVGTFIHHWLDNPIGMPLKATTVQVTGRVSDPIAAMIIAVGLSIGSIGAYRISGAPVSLADNSHRHNLEWDLA